MGGTAVWQRRDVVVGGNLSTEFRLPKPGALGGKSDTLCSMNAQYNNKGNGQVRMVPGAGQAMPVPILVADFCGSCYCAVMIMELSSAMLMVVMLAA
jgi:hypothetical protein